MSLVDRATRHAVLAYGEGASVELDDLRVSGTLASPCHLSTCAEDPGGNAITCAERGGVTLRGFVAEGSAQAGVLAVQGCVSVACSRGRIAGNALGVLTDATSSVPVLDTDVVVDDNGTNFEVTHLRVERPAL